MIMCDGKKFKGFKGKLVEENEAKYGAEVRERYGDKAADESNARMMDITQEQYDRLQSISGEILGRLEAAVTLEAAPDSEEGCAIASLHKDFLGFTWPSYTKEAHQGLVQMYLEDERFTAYYDKKIVGCAKFLRDAVFAWTE